ncbi:MAG TPA: hypothetical protein VN778_02355 [Verrucomicrobiae bacterium]|nr:hypothetical protein [Verrucomicrobiae bacterium]
MSEIDMKSIVGGLGVDEETVQRWKDAGLIKPKPLKGVLRRGNKEDIQRAAEAGTLYGPMPEGLLTRLAKSVETPNEPNLPAGMVEKLSPGQKILFSFQAKSANLKTQETTDDLGNPQLRVFYKHIPVFRLAPPGTRLPIEGAGADTSGWRVEETRFPAREQNLGSFVVDLASITDVLPGDVATWATQASVERCTDSRD